MPNSVEAIEILIGFYKYHPVMRMDALSALRVVTCSYQSGFLLAAEREIDRRLRQLSAAHGGKVEELDRRCLRNRSRWLTDEKYLPLLNRDLGPAIFHLLRPIQVNESIDKWPTTTGNCSENETYPGMP